MKPFMPEETSYQVSCYRECRKMGSHPAVSSPHYAYHEKPHLTTKPLGREPAFPLTEFSPLPKLHSKHGRNKMHLNVVLKLK